MSKKMFLIDGSNHAFRVHFALPPMHAADGFPTRALYGFANMLAKLIREDRPDYIVVCFDKGKTFRHDLYAEYKGHRPDMPEELRQQWPLFAPLVEAFGFPCLTAPGFEADDILGTLARTYGGPDMDVRIVSGDHDLWQLVNEHVHVVDLMKGRELGRDEVIADLGLPPELVTDLKGLAGDSSDNIPGVPGIGPKKAVAYLERFGDLEGVLANAAAVGGKTGERLVEHADNARLSKVLATIAVDVDLGLDLGGLEPRGMQVDALRDLFDTWGFGSLAAKILPARSVLHGERYRCVTNEHGLVELIAEVKRAKHVAVDLETTGAEGEWVGAALVTDQTAAYVPFGRFGVALDAGSARSRVAELLASPDVSAIFHDSKAAWHLLARSGFELPAIGGDVMLASYVLAAGDDHSLEALALRLLGHTLATANVVEDLFAGMLSMEELMRAHCERAEVIGLLHERLDESLDDALRGLYRDIELPLVPVLGRMERAGIALDVSMFSAIQTDLAAQLIIAEQACHDALGRPFNVNSRNELQAILFEELGLPGGKKVKGGYSTDASVLDKLAELHPLPDRLLEYRKLSKLLSTYVVALPGYVRADGRVHTDFRQAVAATGRLSSQNPNLQNIPIRSFEGRRLREAFVPAPGTVFLSADYSQIELRVLAHYCGEGPLVDAFLAGEDIHRRTASEIFGVPLDQVEASQRQAAKAINFGLLYGMSAFRLAGDLAIPRTQAQEFMDDYFGRMPQVKGWLDATREEVRESGIAYTLFGRRRRLPAIQSKRFQERAAAEREALNTPIQGTAADIIKRAMIRVDQALATGDTGARILLQVHDELLLEVPEERVDEVRALVIREMMAAADLIVPLEVNTATGHTWNQAHG